MKRMALGVTAALLALAMGGCGEVVESAVDAAGQAAMNEIASGFQEELGELGAIVAEAGQGLEDLGNALGAGVIPSFEGEDEEYEGGGRSGDDD